MKKLKITLLLLTFLPALNFAQQSKKNLAYSIENINAYLYFETKGEFSKVPTDSIFLWNTIIGEGGAGSSSSSTMVIVKIKRNFDKGMENRKIRLTATVGKKTIIKQTTDFILYDNNYYYFAAFWLYDTGCENIKLTAEILNETTVQNKKSITVETKMEKNIDFECGE